MLNNYFTALVRTYCPLAVAYVVTYLAEHFNIVLSDDQSKQATAIIVAAIYAVYYAGAKLLEQKIPALTWLLGTSTQPVAYAAAAVPSTAAHDDTISDADFATDPMVKTPATVDVAPVAPPAPTQATGPTVTPTPPAA